MLSAETIEQSELINRVEQLPEIGNESLPTREQILRLQESMLPIAEAMPEAEHHFAPGMYLRSLTVPAKKVVVGKTHKHEHFFLVLKGSALVGSEQGWQLVHAGHISVPKPGIKRVVVTLEETQFVNVHVNPTDTQDLEIIEAEHIEPEALGIPFDMTEVLK